jgi:HEAT repeat protein
MEERTAMLPLLLAALLSTTPAAQAQSPPSPAASDVRSAVIAADDARLASPAHRKVVEDTLKNGPTDAQVLAVRALGRTRRAEWLPAATAALDHVSIDVRREAAFSVAQRGAGAAVGRRTGPARAGQPGRIARAPAIRRGAGRGGGRA